MRRTGNNNDNEDEDDDNGYGHGNNDNNHDNDHDAGVPTTAVPMFTKLTKLAMHPLCRCNHKHISS